jgi:cobalt-zinc-cadmium efflux system membrane fusion protein
VFQAKGDWCAEHGFPESFCPQCHPERGGKPAIDVTADSPDAPPADGTRIKFRSKEIARLAGIETAPAVAAPGNTGLVAVARIAYDATRVAYVNARAPGVVRSIAVDIGARVSRGAALASIESAAVGADQSKLRAAEARVAVAEADAARVRDLLARGIVPAKEALHAEQELEVAKADLEATRRALSVVGGSAGEGVYTLEAPLAGIVTQRNISIGTLVDVEAMLFEIVDPRFMWAEIDIREADLSQVRAGQAVIVSVDGLGERTFPGRIEYIAPAIDPKTRTAMARARLDNPDGLLRANMYGRAEIVLDGTSVGVAVPSAAIQQAKGVPVVFVRMAEDLYVTRRVALGARTGDLVALTGGVKPGDLVVTQGSFLLKTETLKESIGAGCCEVESN